MHVFHVTFLLFLVQTTMCCTYSNDSEGPRRLKVTEGERAAILCPEATEQLVILLQWFREGDRSPIYEFRKIPETESPWKQQNYSRRRQQHRPRPDWVGRAFFLGVRQDPPALTVTKLRASDSGAYTCKVSYAEGTSQICTTDVHVVGTEELPLVYDSEGKTVQGKIGPYLEGSSLALTCEAGSDFDLSWHWNSTVLPGKRHIDIKAGVVRSRLVHPNISRSDLHADITCTASNSFGDDFKRALKLDVWTKPTDIRVRPRPFNEDAAASVECEVLGSRPSPLVTWYLGEHGPLDASFTHDQTDDAVTTSVLTFTARAGDSGKTLMCVAGHRIFDYKINTSFVVDVQYEPKVVLSLNASRPGAGEDVYLECEIQANPMATHVHWYLNSDPIAAFPLDVYQHTVTLRKTQVTPRDSGEYQCAALSSYGVGRSNVVNIYINEKGSGDLSAHLSVDIQLISFSALASATSYFSFP